MDLYQPLSSYKNLFKTRATVVLGSQLTLEGRGGGERGEL